MARDNFGQCRGCGKRILWIRTKAGKNMPVDPVMLNYRKDACGKEKIVTPSGEVVTGTTDTSAEDADGIGYVSHFATCPNARSFRKGRA